MTRIAVERGIDCNYIRRNRPAGHTQLQLLTYVLNHVVYCVQGGQERCKATFDQYIEWVEFWRELAGT